MASSASDLLKLELQATGENNNTWGTKANTAFSRLEEAIAGFISISLNALGGAGYTLDDTQYQENSGSTAESHVAIIKCTGTLDSNEVVTVPARTKEYLVWNATSGSFSVTFTPSGGTGIAVPQGSVMRVFSDGTNAEAATLPVTVDGYLAGNLNMNANQIVDANGNELIKFTETGSAVNEFTIDNAATGNAPALKATGDDTNIDIEFTPKGTGTAKVSGTAVALTGVHSIPVPARAMYTRTTSGAATGTAETTTNQVMIDTFDFDATADEFVQFQVAMPKSWNEGTVTAKFYWSHSSTTTNFGVAWAIQGLALGNSDALDTAFGTAVVVTDTGGTTDDIFVTSDTSAVTIAGTPASEDLVIFQVYRDVSDAADDLAIDARLHAVKIDVTFDTGNDA